MKFQSAIFLTLILCSAVAGQDAKKDWTPWAAIDGSRWAEFQVIVDFVGGPKSPEAIAKAKSLKVKCLIAGRISRTIPAEIEGVKYFKILYSEYGKFLTREDFMEDWAELLYSKEGVNVRPVTITGPASQFDLLEGAKPAQEINMSTINPTILVPLGVEPVTTRKLTGRIYRLKTEWRRRGNTVEIRLKDYRTN
jgi:hypothetical protein